MTSQTRDTLFPVANTALLVLLLSACSHTPSRYTQRHDSAPARHVDVAQIPDAVPRQEPRSRYGNPDSYTVFGKKYHTLKSSSGYVRRGIASWYGTKFHGHRTSSGETYDMYAMTAAHKTLPLPTYARVTNLENGRSVIVKINDRGPFHDNRLIDLSYAAAARLDIMHSGTGKVEIRTLDWAASQAGRPGKPHTAPSRPKVGVVPASTHITSPGTQQHDSMYLQLGSFTNADNAQRLKQKLSASNFEGVHITQATNKQQRVYRVRIGPLDDADSASTLANMLEAHGIVSPRVVID